MSDLAMTVKRALRPLIPDRVMARYRLHQHSKATRVNVDIAIADPAEARRWLAVTPDTYRVIDPAILGDQQNASITIPDDADAASAARMLSRPDIGAAVVGEVEPPRLVDRRRAEPLVAPIAMAIRPEILAEVGGLPPGDDPLPGLLARVGDAGHRIGLVPIRSAAVSATRTDPIHGEAVIVLAAVPMHDVGGGSRGAQMTFELVRRGYHVTYVHLYPSFEQVDLGLRYIHPRLEQVRFDRFDASVHAVRAAGGGTAILELPAPHYVGAVTGLQRAGWEVVYDVIDDWSDPALGGDWYDPALEADVVSAADAVIASAPDLVQRAATLGRKAVLVPNAVNDALFSDAETSRPADLPEGRLIGYHGSLYGAWFDWEALTTVARQQPKHTVVLIGEVRGVPAGLPDNVVFLGLKAQPDLPGYLSRLEVGIVPFAVTPTTHAVSPLKVYEYLASGVPVAAPRLRALDGLAGVYTDRDLSSAVAVALEAPRPNPRDTLRSHSWGNRLTALFGSIDRRLSDPTDEGVKVERRPAVHYSRKERRVIAPIRGGR